MIDHGSVPLDHYRTHPGCGVQLHCLGCQLTRDFDLEVVIARLDARGLDGPRVGIKAVADYVTDPCPRCGGTRFETRPAWRRSDEVDHGAPYQGFSTPCPAVLGCAVRKDPDAAGDRVARYSAPGPSLPSRHAKSPATG